MDARAESGEEATQGEDSGSASSVVLSEILVTGEKLQRSLGDTSSSVEVFDSARIESIPNAVEVRDLLSQTPNVTDVGTGNDLPTVRGIDGSGPVRGAYAFLAGTRPRLNLSVDGRSLTYNELAFGAQSLWDVEQVEVFRGPQSRIQGRNAIAGAVVVTSKDPTFHWEGAAKGRLGEQEDSQAAAMISGPIVDQELALRLSLDRQRRESFVDLISYDPVGDPREIEATTARAKLLYEPSAIPGLSTKLSVDHYETRAPQNEALLPAPEEQSARFDARRPVFETNTTSGIWDIAWEASERFSLESKLVYTDFSSHRLAALTLPYADIDGEEFQIEPLLRFSDGGERLRGLAGLRYFHGTQDEFVNVLGGNDFDDETETTSAFAEVTYSVRPQIDVTLAGRFEREHRTRQGGNSSVVVDLDETYSAFLPKLDIAWKPREGQTLGAMVSRGYNAGGAGITFYSPIVNYTFDPEYVWNYELYSRHRLQDGRLELTSNIFYNDYTDMQLPYYLASNSVVVRNADEAQTYGAEFGARWLATPDLELFGSLGLLRTEITRFSDSGIEGNELPRSPDYTANLGATYMLGHGIEVSGNLQFSDGYYSYYDNDELGRVSAYWLANLQLAYNFKGGRVTLFAQNLFDSDDWIMVVDNDITSPIVQRPRLLGAAVELMF